MLTEKAIYAMNQVVLVNSDVVRFLEARGVSVDDMREVFVLAAQGHHATTGEPLSCYVKRPFKAGDWLCPRCMDTGYFEGKPSSLHDDPCPDCGGDPERLRKPSPMEQELLKTLKDVLRELVTPRGFPDAGKGRTERQQEVFDAARAVIAKAG